MVARTNTFRTFKNIAILVSGAAVAQVFTILISPILTRIYTPEDFGIMALFVAILVLFSEVDTLGFRLVIPIAHDNRQAAHIFVTSLIIAGLFSVLIIALICLFGGFLVEELTVADLRPYLWLLPVGFVISVLFSLTQSWWTREKNFKRIAWGQASQGIAAGTVQIIMGLSNVAAFGLIFGKLFGILVGLLFLRWRFFQHIKPYLADLSVSYGLRLCKQYYRFPLYKAPSLLVTVLNNQLVFILFTVFFGPAVTGLYALTNRVLQAPVVFLGLHIQRLFLSTATESQRAGRLATSSILMYRALLKVALPGFAIFGLIAPDVFSILFGANWRQAGVFAQWLMPYMFFAFVGKPFSILPLVYNKQSHDLAFQLILFVAQGMAISIAGVLNDEIVAIVMLSLIGSSAWAWYVIWALSLVEHPRRMIVDDLVRELLYTLPFLAPVVIAKGLFIEPLSLSSILVIALASMTASAIFVGFRLKRMLSI